MKNHILYKIYSRVDVVITSVCMILMVILTFVGVIMRYVFNSPIVWQEEAQLALIIWITFYGGSYAFREKSHIAIDIVVEALPIWLQHVVMTGIYLVTMGILAFMLQNGWQLLGQFLAMKKLTTSLRIPSAWIYSAVPVGLGLMMVSATLNMIQDIGEWKTRGEKDDN